MTHGLTEAEAAERRRQFGKNVLPSVRKRRIGRMLRDQAFNMIVVLLAVASVISWMSGDHVEATTIAVVLVLNALIGFVTEWQAGRALDALRRQMAMTASVRRDGAVRTLPAEELVAGDVVLLAAGDRVPADLKIIDAVALRVDEAMLTGESATIFKAHEAMLFLGTIITAGRAEAEVVATGEKTELGRIGRLVVDAPEESTPLQRHLDALGRRLAWIVMIIAVVVTAAGWLRGENLWRMIEVGISLAVAAVPEGLPAVTTFILAFGVLRMANQHAIVRRLTAVETLGSTTVICSDKTGTLTWNRMTVTAIEPESEELLRIAALCNDATASSGDPTEIALVIAAQQHGIDVDELRRRYPRVSELPFDAKTKRMVTIHRHGERFLFALKGAPDVVLAACEEAVPESNALMASKGLRVLAFARKEADSIDDDGRYAFAGLIGMIDPPREGVLDAIATAKRAGIRIVMLTGDQADTARAIGRELGIDDVRARVSPEEKYRIVETLQAAGEIVAATGDGVNDAPALKKSDVGIAMGERGTEVAKQAADIVLTDDNFSTIVAAIAGGRTIYANIRRFVQMMFTHNLAEVVTVFVATIAGWPLPLLPLQILWMNLVTDVFPAFALALEPASPDAMERPPRDPSAAMLSRSFLILVAWQAAVLSVIALTAYLAALARYGGGSHAQTIALTALVGVEIGQTFNCRSRLRSAFDGLWRNPHIVFATATVLALQLIAVSFAPLRSILGLTMLNRWDAMVFALAIVLPVVIVEIQKAICRRR